MSLVSKLSSAVLAASVAIACAPLASAAEVPAATEATDARPGLAFTTFASGAIGDTFQCGGAVGRLWCE